MPENTELSKQRLTTRSRDIHHYRCRRLGREVPAPARQYVEAEATRTWPAVSSLFEQTVRHGNSQPGTHHSEPATI